MLGSKCNIDNKTKDDDTGLHNAYHLSNNSFQKYRHIK